MQMNLSAVDKPGQFPPVNEMASKSKKENCLLDNSLVFFFISFVFPQLSPNVQRSTVYECCISLKQLLMILWLFI